MRVTDIAATKKGRMSVFLDGEFAAALHMDVFARSGLSVGDEVEPGEFADLQYESELKITKERALRLLSGQDYTRRQLVDRLRRYACAEIAEEAAQRMSELGLLDDADYAMRCARDLVHLRHFSPRRAGQELRRRGIGPEAIEAALEQFEEDDPREAIARLLQRKYSGYDEDEKTRRRAVNGLLRLGYSYGDVRYVMENPDEFDGE